MLTDMHILPLRESARHTLLPLLFGAASIALVLGCQPMATSQSRESATAAAPLQRVVEVSAHDYEFTAPETLPAGLSTIRLVNHGREPHHGQLLRLNEGVSYEEFGAALESQGEGALRFVSAEGGPGAIGPDGTSEVTVDLKPGSYVLACFIASPDGVPHLAKGMLKPIQVTSASASTTGSVQSSKATFTMKDFSFEMPAKLPAGRGTYKVVNAGPQIHELNIVKLAPGTSLDNALEWAKAPAGPPPFEFVGGINAFGADGSGYMHLDLTPGQYVAVCNVPDPATNLPHAHLGMYKAFSVDG
jgi:hypothetical protein